MSRARDIIEEIAQVRSRRQSKSAETEMPMRLFAIERAFEEHDATQVELMRYFPVGLIACLEGFFRMAIKELVDMGDPYLANADRIAGNKIEFSILRAIHGKAVTVGELVAHGVSLSRLDHVESTMTTLLGTSFLGALRTVKDRWLEDRLGDDNPPILSMPDNVFADVVRTFELRHIICHEIASAYEIQSDEVKRCFESCVLFLRAADELVSQLLRPGPAPTQRVMNDEAGASLQTKKDELDQVLREKRARVPDADKPAFDLAQEKWQSYCDSWTEFVAAPHMGSIRPLIYANAAEEVVRCRLDELRGWLRLHEPE